MLDRLISEDRLRLKKVPEKLFPESLYIKNEPKPEGKSLFESFVMVEKYRPKVLKPTRSIVCLIYKSTQWLEFVFTQVMKYTDMKDVEFYFVANDATTEVLNCLKINKIPHYIWNNTAEHKKEWYINNVYRAYNFGARKAKSDFLIFINSDMAFSPNWLNDLAEMYTGKNCLVSRMVESGKLKSGLHAISKNFGRTVKTYKEEKFLQFAEKIKKHVIKNSGLYGPLFINKKHFLSVDGYPEGNVNIGSNIWKPKMAKQGELCVPGDVVLMEKLKSRSIIHQTVFNSVIYHFQEGEKGNNKKTNKYLSPSRYIKKIQSMLGQK
jgi:acetyltransferase-like isoleucine patch superfamily enzyme